MRWRSGFFTFAGILHLVAQRLKDTFDRMPAADGYVRLDLLIAAGTERANIKLMGGTL